MSLTINKEQQGTTMIWYFDGTMDISVDSIFSKELNVTDPSFDTILLDFHNLEFIDSTGIGFIMEIIYLSKENDKKVQFRGLDDMNREIFETIGILHLLNEFKGEMV